MQNFKDGIFLGLYYVLFFTVYLFLSRIVPYDYYSKHAIVEFLFSIAPLCLHIYIYSCLISETVGEFFSKALGLFAFKALAFLIILLLSYNVRVSASYTKAGALSIMAFFSFNIFGDILSHVLSLIATLIYIHKEKRDLRNRYKTKKYNEDENPQDN